MPCLRIDPQYQGSALKDLIVNTVLASISVQHQDPFYKPLQTQEIKIFETSFLVLWNDVQDYFRIRAGHKFSNKILTYQKISFHQNWGKTDFNKIFCQVKYKQHILGWADNLNPSELWLSHRERQQCTIEHVVWLGSRTNMKEWSMNDSKPQFSRGTVAAMFIFRNAETAVDHKMIIGISPTIFATLSILLTHKFLFAHPWDMPPHMLLPLSSSNTS